MSGNATPRRGGAILEAMQIKWTLSWKLYASEHNVGYSYTS